MTTNKTGKMANTDFLKARIAEALGWSERDVNTFSLASLRDLVRPVNPALAEEIFRVIQDGSHLLVPYRKPRPGRSCY